MGKLKFNKRRENMSAESAIAIICDHLGAGFAKAAGSNFYGTVLRLLLQAIAQKTESIDRKVTRLLEGPYKTGLDFLNDAQTATTRPEQLGRVEKAGDKFSEAAGQLEGPMKARAHFYAGVCYDLRLEHKTALGRYAEAFSSALSHETAAWNKSKRPRRTGERIGLGGAVASAPLIMGSVILTTMAVGGLVPFLVATALTGALSASLPKAGRGIGGLVARRRQQNVKTFHESFVCPLAALLVHRDVTGELSKTANIIHHGGIPWAEPIE
jgi:hypothetical protein